MNFGSWNIALDMHPGKAVQLDQVHGGRIVAAQEAQEDLVAADGIYTKEETVAVRTADCMPLILIDGSDAALALHVSRKSLVAGLLDAVSGYIDVSDIRHAYIGPHICERHFLFEYEGDEIRQFKQAFPEAVSSGQNTHISLAKAVKRYFSLWKVQEHLVHGDVRCTYEDAALPSYKLHREQGGGKALDHLYTILRKNQ